MTRSWIFAAFALLCISFSSSYCFAQGTCPANVPVTGNHCYFVAANGSDSNNGTSESTPWLHGPGMPNCSNTCLSAWKATLSAGTGIIFRGGDTWHFGNPSASPYTGGVWNLNTSPYPTGSSSAPIYIGVDQSWYSGSSWARPIFTGDNPLCNANTLGANCISGGTNPNPGEYYVNSCAYQVAGGQNGFFDVSALSYYIIDNFEMTGLCQSHLGQSLGYDTYVNYSSDRGPMTFENLYIHGWSHLPFADNNGGSGCTSSTVCFDIFAFVGFTGNGHPLPGETIKNCVVDGSDSDPIGGGLGYAGFYNVYDNVFRYVSQLIVRTAETFHDNLYEYYYENGHSNLWESVGEPGNAVIYNNVIRHLETVGATNGVGFWIDPNVGNTTYFFNNVMYDVGAIQYLGMSNQTIGKPIGNTAIFNNTLQLNSGVGGDIITCQNNAGGTVTDSNNHLITDSKSYIIGGCANTTSDHALKMSNATATADGYTPSQTYVYSPTSASSPTAGAGTNRQSFCSALSGSSDPLLQAAGTACASDTGYACSYNTIDHTVNCPARTMVSRPSSASWDLGAYQFSNVGTPGVPQNLTGIAK